ncbi:MAG: hypothetical protein ACLFNP_06895 [Spirochaetaceae bacterium]
MSGMIPTTARNSRVHHVRELSEHTYVLRMDRGDLEFEPGQYISVGPKNDLNMREYYGRVTDYLRAHPVSPEAACFLCGNCDMIYEAFDILQEQGIPHDRLFAEVYF